MKKKAPEGIKKASPSRPEDNKKVPQEG